MEFDVIWSFLVPLLISLIGVYSIGIVFNMKFEYALPVFYAGSALLVYLSAILGLGINVGLIILCCLYFLVLIKVLLKTKRKHIDTEKMNSYMLWGGVFLVIYLAIYIYDYNRGFNSWDEMSHWGPMVKEMLRLDTLYSVPESRSLVHKDYPPIIAIFEAIWCKICGGYAERYLYRSIHVLAFSMVLPVVFLIKEQPLKLLCKMGMSFGAVATIVLSVLLFDLEDGNFFATIYTDGMVAFVFAFCMFLIFLGKEYSWQEDISLIIACSCLLLTKQVGIEYYMITLFAVVLLTLYDIQGKRVIHRIGIRRIAGCILVPGLFKISWSIYCRALGLSGQFAASKFDLSALAAILNGRDKSSWRYQGTQLYFEAIMDRPLMRVGNTGISYAGIFIVFCVLSVILILIGRKAGCAERVVILSIAVLCGAIGHVIMMWIIYLFGYNERDLLMLICYGRYMNVYWFGAGILYSGLLVWTGARCSRQRLLWVGGAAVLAGLLILAIGNSSIKHLLPAIDNNSNIREYYAEAEFLQENTSDDAGIYLISQSYTGYQTYVFQYLLLPQQVNITAYSLGLPYSEGDNWTYDAPVDDLEQRLSGYDYLYFYHVDAQFMDRYNVFLSGNESAEYHDGELYRLITKDDNVVGMEFVAAYALSEERGAYE